MPSTYSGGSVSFLGSGNVSVLSTSAGAIVFSGSQSTAPAAISASDHLYTSGTIILSGGSNVTVSTNGQTVLFHGAAAGTASAGIGAVSASDTVYTSGTVVFTGTHGITVNTSGTGTQQTVGISGHNHGAIIASDATFTSGTVVFSGSSNVTVLTAGTGTQQTILFSAPNPGAGGATAISGIKASDATYTSGTVVFTGSNAITVKSGTGQRVIIDMTESTHAHSAFVLSASNGLAWGTNASTVTGSYSQSTHSHSTGPSAISASDTAFTSGTVVLSGSGITVNTSGTGTQQTVGLLASTHSHDVTAAIQSIVPLGQTLGTTTTLSGPVVGLAALYGAWISQVSGANSSILNVAGWSFSNSNNITFGSNVRTITASFSQSTHSHSTAPSAISASDTAFTSGTVVFSGAGGWVTINTSGTGTQQTVGVSVSTHTHSAATGISGIQASDATYTSGTVIFTGSNAITVKSDIGQRVVIDMTQSTHSHATVPSAISASNSAFTSGTVVFSGTGGWVTVNTSGTGTQQTVGISVSTHSHAAAGALGAISASDTAFTSGTVVFSGSTNVTVLTSGTGTQQTILFSAPDPGGAGATAISGIVASNTTYTSGTVILTGSNAITVKSGAGQSVVIDMTQSTHSHSTGPSAIIGSDATYTSGSVVFTGSNAITVKSGAGQKIVIDMTESTHAHSAYVFSNSNNVSFGTNGSTVTATATASQSTAPGAISASNSAFTSGTVVFSGTGGWVTVNTSGTGTQQTIGISVSTHSHAAGGALGAISASNATFTSGTVVFSGTNGITVNTSGTGTQQTVGISGHNHGAIVGSNATFTSGTVVFSGGTNITVNTSGTGTQQTIGFSVADQSTHGHGTAYEFSPTPRGPIQGAYGVQALSTAGSLTVFPVILPAVNAQTLRFAASLVTTTFTNSSGSLSWGLAYYTRANATALSSVSSTSWSSSYSASATSQMSNVSGARVWSATMSWPLTAGEYYFAAFFQSSGAGTMSMNNYTISTLPAMGLAGAASAASDQYQYQFYGLWTSATASTFPSSFAASHMKYSSEAVSFPMFQIMGT